MLVIYVTHIAVFCSLNVEREIKFDWYMTYTNVTALECLLVGDPETMPGHCPRLDAELFHHISSGGNVN